MEQLPNILIVDDAEENILLLVAIIKKIKVNVIKALSGEEALKKTAGIDLALAIVDVMMPRMSGFEFAVKLNKERQGDKVPVIFLTANYYNETDVFEGYDSGAVDYIYKPLLSKILLGKISVFIDLFKQKQTVKKDIEVLTEYADELIKVNLALKISEEKYRSYIDNAPDGVFILDKTGKCIEINESICRMTGYSKEDLFGMLITDLFPAEFLKENWDEIEKAFKLKELKTDLPVKHKNGTICWWAVVTVKLEKTRFLFFAKEITDRKKTEEKLKNSLSQLQQLSQHTEKAIENERKLISRELHDDLGQALTAVKIDLGIIKQQVTGDEIINKISKVSNLVGDTIRSVQRITAQLRPEIIDDLGLEAAIGWYTNEFAQRNNIEIVLNIDQGLTITPDTSLLLFRILQESLTNVARHAQANRVDIKLEKIGTNIHFSISDNGVGIKESDLRSKKSFGIIGMNERSTLLGGTFKIYRGNNHGTIINLIFPLNN